MGPARPSARARQLLAALPIGVMLIAASAAPSVAAPRHAVRRWAAPTGVYRLRASAFRARSALLGGVMSPFGSGSALVGSAPVGNGPDFSALDPATHTLYVTNGFNEIGNPAGGNTVSVVDTRRCQAQDVSRCKGPWPTITVGNLPSSVAVDEKTDTVYVSNAADNTVSVFNGAICNAENISGCGQTPATVPVGMVPVAIFADPADHTIYIPNGAANSVSMLDSASCNATDLTGCPTTPPPTVELPGLATAGDVDPATHTAYVTICANNPFFGCAPGTDGVAVFDTRTCNAAAQSGCKRLGTLEDSNRPLIGAAVDAANHTLYTANGDNTVSAFDLRRCNASDLAACATETPGVLSFPGPQPGFDVSVWVAVDARQRSIYVSRAKDDSVIVVDTSACNGSNPAGCATIHPPVIHAGSEPEILTLDPRTETLYAVNQLGNNVSVIDATRCNAQITTGCRHLPPAVPISTSGLAVDPGVATIYGPGGENTVSMIDTTQCNASNSSGCSHIPPTVTVGAFPRAAAVNPVTHTVYVADGGSGSSGSVSLFDDRACNATRQTGCGKVSTLQVPDGNPVNIAINPLTDTLYVATLTSNGGPNLISVFDGATCNATNTTGCDQTPANVQTGNDGGGPFSSTEAVAVNPATNTIYATSDTIGHPFLGDTVYMIDGTTCDATNTTGCDKAPATISVGTDPLFGDANPFGIAIDQRTDTIYTANIRDGEALGTVSVINGATCNSQNTSGCGQTPATAPAGFGAVGIAIDELTNQIYATNTEDTSVTTINGNSCNGTNATGCDHAQTGAIVGDYPGSIAVDPQVGTAYVQAFEGVSVIPLNP